MTFTSTYAVSRPASKSVSVPLWAWAAWIGMFAVFSAVFPRDAAYDVLHYQIHNGWAAANGRLWQDFAPADMHSFINPAYSLFVWWLIDTLPGPAVSAILSIPQAFILPGLYYLTRGLSAAMTGSASRTICLVVAACGFLADGHLALFASIRNDAWGAAAFIWALSLSFRSDGMLADLKSLALASLVLGAALGMKATSLPYAIAYCAFVMILASGHGERIRAGLVCAAAGAAMTAALALPYAWVLWSEFGNPVFPMANGVFESPLGPTDYDAYARRKPEGLFELFAYPFVFTFNSTLISLSDQDDLRLLLGYLSSLGLLIVLAGPSLRKLIPAGHRLLLAFTVAFLVGLFAWMQAFSVLRYYLAGWMLGPVLVYLVLMVATGKPALTPLVQRASMGVVLVMIALSGPDVTRRTSWGWMDEPYVTASIPQPERFEDAFILFTGDNPSAFLATQFPATATFGHAVMQDYFSPALENYQPLMRQAVWSSERPVYAVMFEPAGTGARASMLERLKAHEQLLGHPGSCERIRTNMDTSDGQWLVCPLERMSETAKS